VGQPSELAGLFRGLDDLGLNVRFSVGPVELDAACASQGFRLEDLLAGGRGALVIGSGGPAFFDRFDRGGRDAPERHDGRPDPLDRYTRRVVEEIARACLGGGARYALAFPFMAGGAGAIDRGAGPAVRVIPFQRLGRAAGLGGPSPLGLQIHPFYGPWWAYRALLVIDRELPPSPAIGDGCAGCHAPCVAACPAGAVRRDGFDVPACHRRRLATLPTNPCRLSCAARVACVRGPEHRYRDEELAFHMAASLPRGGAA
jgi:ferredoxin